MSWALVSQNVRSDGICGACKPCGLTCQRERPCGHACELPCHTGECPPCRKDVEQACHCGRSTIATKCCIMDEVSRISSNLEA